MMSHQACTERTGHLRREASMITRCVSPFSWPSVVAGYVDVGVVDLVSKCDSRHELST